MKVAKEKVDNLIKKLQPHICPLCHKGQWIVSDTIFYLNEFNKGGVVIGGPSYPVLPLVCSECGNTIFINAIISDILDVDNNKNKEEK